MRLFQGEHYADAAIRFQGLQNSYPELADYHLYYGGVALARSGRAADAVAPLQEVLSLHPSSVQRGAAALELGRVQRQLGHLEAARDAFRIAGDSQDPAVVQRADLELARVDVSLGDLADAAVRLQRVRRAAPRERVGQEARAELQRLRADHPEIAPTGPDMLDELRVLLAERDFDAAETLARRLLAQTDSYDRAEVLHLHASALLSLGRIDEALTDLRTAARAEAGTTAATTEFRVASILWNHDRDAEALRAFTDLRRRFPRAPNATEALYAIGRIHEKAGRMEPAIATYRQLAASVPRSRLGREAQWRIGWIQYRDGRWQRAAQSFGVLARCRDTADCAGGLYWEARALEHAGQVAAARDHYQRIASEAPASYYAMWAEQRLGYPPATVVTADPPSHPALPATDADGRLQRVIELSGAGFNSFARRELAAYEHAHADDRAALRRLLPWYRAVDGDGAALRLAQRLGPGAGLSAAERARVMYPLGFWSLITATTRTIALDPLLVAALIRQESLYDPDARSPADAYGLMQLLPSTAERVAGGPVSVEELRDPPRNIALGTRYLKQLLSQFGGDEIKAIAAYNGGEAAVEKWQQRFAGRERDEFVESISFRETRDYVKRVIGGYRRYRALYGASATRQPSGE
ncbi:MAG TPA: transglycosylase SLT domain-containing protein [Candidatus Kryptonia bacterium]|nr:transglycosylase SLT domain-containing protein [Candidatus Kryptonia bacterium]